MRCCVCVDLGEGSFAKKFAANCLGLALYVCGASVSLFIGKQRNSGQDQPIVAFIVGNFSSNYLKKFSFLPLNIHTLRSIKHFVQKNVHFLALYRSSKERGCQKWANVNVFPLQTISSTTRRSLRFRPQTHAKGFCQLPKPRPPPQYRCLQLMAARNNGGQSNSPNLLGLASS